MKKTISIVLLAAMAALAVCGCAGTAGNTEEILAGKGLEMIARMDELASSEAYAGSMTSSNDMLGVVGLMGEGEYGEPKAIYSVNLPKDDTVMALMGERYGEMPGELSDWMLGKAYASLPAQLIARSGAEALAAASMVSYSDSFVCKGLAEPALYIYMFEGDYCAMAAFRPGQDGAVSGSVMFVPYMEDALPEGAAVEDISALIEECFGISGIEVLPVENPGAK